MSDFEIITITPENLEIYGVGCIRDKKHPGVIAKKQWYLENFPDGVRMKQLLLGGRYGGFIEYAPGSHAWRPVKADGYLFIHCIWVNGRKNLRNGYGRMLVESVVEDARRGGYAGVAVTASEGSWLAGKDLFLNNGFEVVESRGRFELLFLKLKDHKPPEFEKWDEKAANYPSTHLLFSHQCPANAKAFHDIKRISGELGVTLHTEIVEEDKHARQMPTGFGVFQLVHQGKVIQDHYISGTRFKNIVKKELE
jgi:hypothetical protein